MVVAARSSLVGTAFRGAWRLASGAEAWSSRMPARPNFTAAVRTCKTQDTGTAMAVLQGDTVSVWPMLRLMALSEAVPRSGSEAQCACAHRFVRWGWATTSYRDR